MTDQPISNSEVAEQLSSLSDALDSKITTISDFLTRAEQLCQSARQSEATVATTRQEIMDAIAGVSIDGSLGDRVGILEKQLGELLGSLPGLVQDDRLGAIEKQLGELLESVPRLMRDVKNYARLAQHMDQCASEVSQWHQELQQSKAEGDTQAHLLEMSSALQSYQQSHQALAEQVALLESRQVDLSPVYGKIQELEESRSVPAVDLSSLEQRIDQLTIGEEQIRAVAEGVVSEREQTLRNEMATIQRDWQDGAAILQQMQVRIESLEGKGGDATTAQLEAIRSEMANLVAKAKTEQESALRDQKNRLEELSSQGGKTTIALVLGVVALGLGLFGAFRR